MTFCNEHGFPHSQFLSWDPIDRSKCIAFLLEQGETCQLCGTAEWEWKENRFAYEPVEKLCHGCYLKEVMSETAGRLPGTTVELIPVTEQRSAQRQLAERRKAEMLRKAREEEAAEED